VISFTFFGSNVVDGLYLLHVGQLKDSVASIVIIIWPKE
jgi:hypothetical protein